MGQPTQPQNDSAELYRLHRLNYLTGDVKFGGWEPYEKVKEQFLTVKAVFENIIGQEVLTGDSRKLVPDNQVMTVIQRGDNSEITPLFSLLFYSKSQYDNVVEAANNLDKIAQYQSQQAHKIVTLPKGKKNRGK